MGRLWSDLGPIKKHKPRQHWRPTLGFLATTCSKRSEMRAGILDHFFNVSIPSENPSKKFWPARICEVAGRPNMGVSWAASVSGGSHTRFTSLLINSEWSSSIAMFSENLITHCKKQQNSPVTESHKIFKCRTFFTQFVHRKTNKSGEGLPAK